MNKSFLSLGIIGIFLFFNFGCAQKEFLYYCAPSLLPATERSMKTAGFWISRHPSPDKIILKSDEITEFNRNIQNELKLTQDIVLLGPSYTGEKLKSEFKETLESFRKRKLYTEDGRKAPRLRRGASGELSFYEAIQSNLKLDSVPVEIKPRYGLIVHTTDLRLLPTEKGLYVKPFDIDFDEIQNSSLDGGTPVVVLNQSKDGKWLYVVSRESAGWVNIQNVGLSSLEQLKIFSNPQNFLVVTKSKADIFLDQDLRKFYDYARMGTRLTIQNRMNQDISMVTIPFRKDDGSVELKTGYVQRRDVHEGFLSYTARNMITQAFELLNAPYGWGGMYGEQDCSAFLQEVFSTVGIFLPRNSQAQAKVGKLLGQFDQNFPSQKKIETLSKQTLGGATILPLKGHIMLFLGTIDDRAYAIHATWGYREHGWPHDRLRVLNRVVVSDLSLGEGSRKGSLLKRLMSVRFIGK